MAILSTSITNSTDDEIEPKTTCRQLSDSLNKPLSILSGHVNPISSLAIAGEFVLSASLSDDIIAWQHPNLRPFSRFGNGEGAVKALIASTNRIFTAHQDRRLRVWRISRRRRTAFRLVATLPTARDYLTNLIHNGTFVQSRRTHRRLWIEHTDTVSCLAVCDMIIYSGSWDKTVKLWSVTGLRCLESIRAHDDAVNALVVHKGVICSASADGKVRVWVKGKSSHSLKETLVSKKEVSWNAVMFDDGGRLVYGGGSDGGVMGWEWEGGKAVCDVRAHEAAVLCICSAAGVLCTGSADGSVGVWRREGGGGLLRIGVVGGHEGPVKCLQAMWSCGGKGLRVYSGGGDKSLRVWWVPMHCGEVKAGRMENDDVLLN